MKLVSLVVLATMSTSLLAGDGGFKLINCMSDSGRSSLTIREDHLSDTTVPYKIVLGVDGDFVTYAPEFKYDENWNKVPVNCEEECLSVKYEGKSLKVSQGEATYLDVVFSGNTATVKKGFYDPRPGYENYQVGSLTLNCKTYIQQP